MIQATLKAETEAPVKVPIFIFTDGAEANEFSKLIVEIKPTYLINLSGSIESLKIHVKRNVLNNICYIMDSATAEEVKNDYNLNKHVKFIDIKDLI